MHDFTIEVKRLQACVPTVLKNRKQWVVWKLETRKGTKKPTKVPYQINGKHAKSNDSSTWNTFEECIKALESGQFDGIGFCFAEGDELFGIDLDNCLDTDGKPETWAQEILDQFASTYTEVTPSKTGFHILGFGHPVVTGSKKWKKTDTDEDQGIEVYDYTSPRYFTVTGNSINGQSLVDCGDSLDWLYQQYFAGDEQHDEPKQARTAQGQVDVDLVQEALTFIPADEYALWIKIGLALKVEGIPFEVWDKWSSKCVRPVLPVVEIFE